MGSGLDPAGVRLRRCGAWTGVSACPIALSDIPSSGGSRPGCASHESPGAARAFDLCSVTPGLTTASVRKTAVACHRVPERFRSGRTGKLCSPAQSRPGISAHTRSRSVTDYLRGKGRRAARLRPWRYSCCRRCPSCSRRSA